MRTILALQCLLLILLSLSFTSLSQAQSAAASEEAPLDKADDQSTEESLTEAETDPDASNEAGEDSQEANEAMNSIDDDTLPYPPEDENYANSPLSIQLLAGRKWYQNDAIFHADEISFAAEWYVLEEFPLKIGPSLSYSKLSNLSEGYNGGQLLDASLRVSSFWDFGLVSPFLAIEYKVYSSGSLDYQKEQNNEIEKATYDLSLTGYDLSFGVQIQAWQQNYLILESSIVNSDSYKFSGSLGQITIDPTDNSQTRQATDISTTETWKFRSISLGLLFEL